MKKILTVLLLSSYYSFAQININVPSVGCAVNTTTLANIPDYVFADDYKLMSLKDLKTFVTINKHLPNIPSAKEYETEGVDLGELNRLLLEKVEELTLYILQMEDGLKVVESAK